MITISNSIFDAQGSSKKDKVFGITLSGAEDILIKDCFFENTGYAAILNNSTGDVTVEGCTFNCSNIYNPIEGSQSVDNGNITVEDCVFNEAPGNNYINFYQFANNSHHKISNCVFAPTVDNNVIRFSNRKSSAAIISIENCDYTFSEGEPTEYTGFILCQDYTNKNGNKQDFTNLEFELKDVTCNGIKVTENGPAEGCIFYVYEDGKGIITDNNPSIIIK